MTQNSGGFDKLSYPLYLQLVTLYSAILMYVKLRFHRG